MNTEFWPRGLVSADVALVDCHVSGAWRTRYSVVGLLPPTSDKGRAAHAADRMVQQGVRVATAAHRAGVPFYMENPVGSLWRRPYMTKWVKKR